jgi:hypothetical protein
MTDTQTPSLQAQPAVTDMPELVEPEIVHQDVLAAPATVREQSVEPAAGFWGKMIQKWEKRFSKLSTRNNFWHRVCSWVWLPLAYRSGIKFGQKQQVEGEPFECVVPFSRFNKNWYKAMAGAALLANSEVAGGMYIFKACGGDYTVVCKHLDYRFRRPCMGPAIYRIVPREDIQELVATGNEFNITVDMVILQAVHHKDEKERRVGNCEATFHVTPKSHYRARKAKVKARATG